VGSQAMAGPFMMAVLLIRRILLAPRQHSKPVSCKKKQACLVQMCFARGWSSRGWFSDLRENRLVWVVGGPGRPRNRLKRLGAKLPTFLKGFWAARDRPEPQNDRCSIKSLNPPLLNAPLATACKGCGCCKGSAYSRQLPCSILSLFFQRAVFGHICADPGIILKDLGVL